MTTSTSEHTITSADVEGKDVLHDLYADWSQIMAATPDLTIRLLRSVFDEWHQPTVEPQGVTYREDTVGGVPGIWCLPEGADTSKVLLYTHGGGFAVGSASSHRKLAAHVAKALGSVSFVLDYRRAPEFGHPAQIEDGVSAFEALVASDIAPQDITTVGDSAGGNLAIAIALALKAQGKPGPGSVIAFSPWLDMENKGETLVTNNDTDALITPELLEGMIAGVLGDTVDPTTPLANPLYADFTGFPPLYVTQRRVSSRQLHPAGGARQGSRRRRHPLHRRGPAARLPVPGRTLRARREGVREARRLVPQLTHPHIPISSSAETGDPQ